MRQYYIRCFFYSHKTASHGWSASAVPSRPGLPQAKTSAAKSETGFCTPETELQDVQGDPDLEVFQ